MLTAAWLTLQDPASAPFSLERVVAHVFVQLVGDHRALISDVLLDGAPEGRMSDVVRAVHDGRQEAARQFVLALSPCLEERHPALDGELYTLVVAKLEVKVTHVLDGAPVATEERIPLVEEKRPCHRTARRFVAADGQHYAVAHSMEHLVEEAPGQVRAPPLPVVRVDVEPVHQGGVFRA